MTTATIQLVLTISSQNKMPIRIHKTVAISLGRTLEGKPMISLLGDPETSNVGVMEVDLVLPAIAESESQLQSISVGITRLAPDGTLTSGETHAPLLPMTPAYKQLTLLEAKYKSENSDA